MPSSNYQNSKKLPGESTIRDCTGKSDKHPQRLSRYEAYSLKPTRQLWFNPHDAARGMSLSFENRGEGSEVFTP